MAGIEVVLADAGRIGVVGVFPPYLVGLFSLRPKVLGPQDPIPRHHVSQSLRKTREIAMMTYTCVVSHYMCPLPSRLRQSACHGISGWIRSNVCRHFTHEVAWLQIPNSRRKLIKLIGHGCCNPIINLLVACGHAWPDCQIAR